MVAEHLYDSLDKPPKVPPFTSDGTIKKAKKEDPLSKAFMGAATAFANVVSSKPTEPCVKEAADVRMKHFEQLRYAKQLCDDGILRDSEFAKQKGSICSPYRNCDPMRSSYTRI